MPDGALAHPAFGDQPFGDGRDGAALQTGMARQIGARDRLVLANQVEQHTPIDVARCLTGRHLYVIQIYLSHGSPGQVIMEKRNPAFAQAFCLAGELYSTRRLRSIVKELPTTFRFLYNL
jgi:hypothetical protein